MTILAGIASSLHPGERRCFAGLEALSAFLEAEAGGLARLKALSPQEDLTFVKIKEEL